MSQSDRNRHRANPVLPYDPVVEVNRHYAETDIEPAYLKLLVGADFPRRRVRRQWGCRRPLREVR